MPLSLPGSLRSRNLGWPLILPPYHPLSLDGSQDSQSPYLRHLSQVRRELETGDVPTVITHDYDGMDGIELHVSDLVLLLGHHGLVADSLVLVDS